MSLQNLEGRTLERIPHDPATVERLLSAARRSLADANIAGLSHESRFDLAYKCVMQCANAALHAHGYRTLTSKPGHHQTMLQSLALTVDLDGGKSVTVDSLRRKRNAIDYSGDVVGQAMADEAVSVAQEILSLTGSRISSMA
jgi:hypothetical protein